MYYIIFGSCDALSKALIWLKYDAKGAPENVIVSAGECQATSLFF